MCESRLWPNAQCKRCQRYQPHSAGAARSESASPRTQTKKRHISGALKRYAAVISSARALVVVQHHTTQYDIVRCFLFFSLFARYRWCCVAFTLVSRSSVSLVTLAIRRIHLSLAWPSMYTSISSARTHAHAATSHQKNLFVPTMLSCVLSVRIFQFVCLFLCVCVVRACAGPCVCVRLCCLDILSPPPPPIIPHILFSHFLFWYIFFLEKYNRCCSLFLFVPLSFIRARSFRLGCSPVLQ